MRSYRFCKPCKAPPMSSIVRLSPSSLLPYLGCARRKVLKAPYHSIFELGLLELLRDLHGGWALDRTTRCDDLLLPVKKPSRALNACH